MRDVRKLERMLLPLEMRKRGVSPFEKLRERGARREKRQRPQRPFALPQATIRMRACNCSRWRARKIRNGRT